MSNRVVTVAAIDQLRWKGLYCDHCDKPFTGAIRSRSGRWIRALAAADGWQTGDADLCPDCRLSEVRANDAFVG